MTVFAERTSPTLWIVLLTAASTITTLVLACATPFPALAAIAATQMKRRDGIALMLVAWLASQAVGFCLLDYPRDGGTLLWAAALGMAAIVAVLAAQAGVARSGLRHGVARVAAAYLIAAVAFKLVILLWSFGLGGVATALSPSINARQLLRNGAILIGLLLLYRGLVSLGLPAASRIERAAA
ncbi:hypothetical protein [Sphingomonas sp. PB4P5]|uniref:hypothetical protein n=1 Tax=Parasphingomonas puruogangriensis TaxID=3096155 RepID=UPI002FC9D514